MSIRGLPRLAAVRLHRRVAKYLGLDSRKYPERPRRSKSRRDISTLLSADEVETNPSSRDQIEIDVRIPRAPAIE